MIHIFTITARNYFSLALTLGQSVAQHHPEARFTICVADGVEGLPAVENSPTHRVLDARQAMPSGVFDELSFKYDVTEFCTSFKPAIFNYLFSKEPDTDLIYYMDPDTRLYDRLDSITGNAPEKTLYLTPHLLECRLEDDNPYPEYHHLWEGIFNLGFAAVRRTNKTAQVLNWWDSRLREYCYSDYADGLHTDQKWMDYAPVYFIDDTHIIRHQGANVAHWNLVERPLSQREGRYFAGHDPLVFFHFSGFNFSGESLNKSVAAAKQEVYQNPTVSTLAHDYREAVKANGYKRYMQIPYAFGFFSDGTPVTKPHRRLYRQAIRKRHLPNAFETSNPFFKVLQGANLLDRSGAATTNYSKSTVENLAGKLTVIGGALRIAVKLLGFKRYAQMVKLFNYLGRFENHGFLVKQLSLKPVDKTAG